jgi:hypothetical protein
MCAKNNDFGTSKQKKKRKRSTSSKQGAKNKAFISLKAKLPLLYRHTHAIAYS